MTTSSSDLRGLQPLPVDPTLPLSRRTQLRLQNMERFTRRLANTSIGYDEKSLAMESAVHALGQLLVAQSGAPQGHLGEPWDNVCTIFFSKFEK